MARSALLKYRLPVASMLFAAAIAGCDNEQSQADKKVEKQLQVASYKASGKLDPKGPKTIKDFSDITAMTDMSEYNSALDSAAKESAASPLMQVQAKVLLAHDELRAAMEKANDAAQTSAMIDRLSLQILALATEIHDNQLQIANLNLSDPKKVTDELARVSELTTGAKGGETWLTTPSGTLPSQAALDKQIASVQSTIDTIQAGIDSDEKERTAAVAESDKYSQQAEAVQGPKMVDLVKLSGDARQKASDLSNKVDQSKVKLDRAKQDLDALNAQRAVAVAAAAQYDDSTQGVNDNWKATQAEIARLKESSQKLLGTDADKAPDPSAPNYSNGGESIASKMALIQKLAAKNKKTRSEAQGHFISAVKFYSDAYTQATKLKADLSAEAGKAENIGKTNVTAWESEEESIAPLNYLLYRGNADLDLATFLARGAEEDLSIKKLAGSVNKVVTDAGLTQPGVLNGIDEPNPKAVTADALKHFTSAASDLKQVYQGQGTSRKVTARSISMYGEYEWSLFDTATGAEDEKAAEGHFELAKASLKDLGSQNVFFSKLPAELAESAPQAPAAPGAPGAPAAPAPAAGGNGEVPVTPAGTGFGGQSDITAASMVGTYSTDPTKPDESAESLLVLAADGTFTMTEQPPAAVPAAQRHPNVATGTYTADNNGITLTLATINGSALPPNVPANIRSKTAKLEDGGKRILDPDGGRAMQRK